MAKSTHFCPDWISAPGDTIGDILRQRQITDEVFAKTIGTSIDEVHKLLKGRSEISEQLAAKLESTIGGATSFWTSREKRYREKLQALEGQSIEKGGVAWLEGLPVKEMTRLGWLPPLSEDRERIAACLRFFGVNSVHAWQTAYEVVLASAVFRTSKTFESEPGAVAAWLRQGEVESEAIKCKPWNAIKFEAALRDVRALTREKDPKKFISALRRQFSDCGVALVVLRAPSGCKASGATRFLTPSKGLMLLSFRYLTDDHFWFSVFHEAGHLVLHKNSTFIDAPEMPSNKEEKEANEFASNALIPSKHLDEMLNLPVDGRSVMRFARQIGVSPGIVVGQLQYLGHLTHRQLNSLKRRYKWTDE
jgi:Zn-dependent peptidase ImmA (M78 family)/plasmid maintenance system antidote protein VapI